MTKILVVEDDLALSTGLCFELDTGGYLTVASYNCQKARQLLRSGAFDLMLLDVNLPDGNGFDLCREIKDYITKPFNIQILKRRIEVALRRQASAAKSSADSYNDGYLCLDFGTLTAVRDGEKLAITPNEYKLLRLLTANAGNIVTRQILLEKLWDCDSNYIDDHTLTVTMNRLRSKIEDASHSYIRTVRGMGYIWTGAGI